MFITDFIREQYPIRDKIAVRLSNPYDKVANNDDLPYDTIGTDESGHVTKLVEVEEDRFISVVDLISYTRKDVEQMNDPALLTVWENYMDQIDVQDINVADIFECVKAHDFVNKKREEQLGVLSL